MMRAVGLFSQALAGDETRPRRKGFFWSERWDGSSMSSGDWHAAEQLFLGGGVCC